MRIRPFQYSDIDQLTQIAKVAFAEEHVAQGLTPEAFINRIKMVTWGRLIPFKIVTALTKVKWGFFVAEVDDKVVGCGGYLGQKNMELANLMVTPEYRRRGIGQALLVKRLQYLAEQGYPFVTTTILATNQASLGNVQKQNFEVLNRYSAWEISLPVTSEPLNKVNLEIRPIQKSDKSSFHTIEQQTVDATLLQIYGSSGSRYFPNFSTKLARKFYGTQVWSRSFESNNKLVGFLLVTAINNQTKGIISGPRIKDEHLGAFPTMLSEAISWLARQGKTTAQMLVPDARTQLIESLQKAGWQKTNSWIQLIKWLNK